MLPDFKLNYKVMTTVWYWHKNRHRINGTGEPRNKPTYTWITYHKGAKNIQNNGERRVSSINGAEKVKIIICKRMKFDHTWYLIPYTKIDSKWTKDVKSWNPKTPRKKS